MKNPIIARTKYFTATKLPTLLCHKNYKLVMIKRRMKKPFINEEIRIICTQK